MAAMCYLQKHFEHNIEAHKGVSADSPHYTWPGFWVPILRAPAEDKSAEMIAREDGTVGIDVVAFVNLHPDPDRRRPDPLQLMGWKIRVELVKVFSKVADL